MNRSILAASVFIAFFGFAVTPHNIEPTQVGAEPLRLKPSGAYQALQYWAEQRAYPHRAIPDDAYYRAYAESRRRANQRLRTKNTHEPWETMGPHNIGGRTLAVALNPLDPNTVYAGSASGGLWRSHTAGRGAAAWERVTTGYPVLGVSSIAIHPEDSNTIYIGTGEVYSYQRAYPGVNIRATRGSYGIGILKTTDAGVTWSKSLDWSYEQQNGVQAVRINPLDPNTVWAATTEGTFKSVDAGGTWEQVHSVIMAMDIAINPLDTSIVFVANGDLGSEGHGIYRTTDAGGTWTQLSDGLPSTFGGKAQLSIYQASPNVLFASIGNGISWGAGTWLCKSTDNGDTWNVVSTLDYASAQGWYSHFVQVHPVDSSIVFCGGQLGMYKSTTGGTDLVLQTSFAYNWGTPPPGGPEGSPQYAHADNHAMVFHPTHPDTFYIANDGGVWRSLDGAGTFESCNGGYQTTQFYAGFSSSQSEPALATGGMQDNYTAIYEGSTAWRRAYEADGAWTAIHPTNPDTMYASAQFLYMIKSVDRLQSWVDITPPRPDNEATAFAAPFVLSPSDPQVLYAGRTIVYKSTNGGADWFGTNGGESLDGNPVQSLALSPTHPDTLYALTAPRGAPPGVFVTTNGGDSWSDITAGLPDRVPSDLAVNPSRSSIVYVSFSGFGSSHLYTSTNMGQTWIDIGSGLPDVPTSAVVVDPLNTDHIYVGNDFGVHVSTDGGVSWQNLHEGLPEAVMVIDLSISPGNRKLRAATHGSGAFERPLLHTSGSWQEQMAGSSNTLWDVDAVSSVSAWAVGNASTVLQTSDGGDNWTNEGGQLPVLSVVSVDAWSPDDAIIAGYSQATTTTFLYRTTDGGSSWTQVFEQSGGFIDDITMFSDTEGIAIGDPTGGVWTILKTTNGGITWEQMPGAPTAAQGTYGWRNGVAWLDGTDGWFGTNDSIAYHTTDGGESWSAVPILSLSSVRSLAFNQTGFGLASSPDDLARTTDGGQSWQTAPAPGSGSLHQVLSLGNSFWLVRGQSVYESADNGLTWEFRTSGHANLRHLSLAATENGVFGWVVGDSGVIMRYDMGSVTQVSNVADPIPERFVLLPNYPNPFNPTTTIRFEIPHAGRVRLTILDITGRNVATLVETDRPAGMHEVTWDAGTIASGVYFCRLQAGSLVATRKLVLLR